MYESVCSPSARSPYKSQINFKLVVYLSEHVKYIAVYAKIFPELEFAKAVNHFKKLNDEDIRIIKAEAIFVVDYSAPASDLPIKVKGSKYPISHVLYSKVREVHRAYFDVPVLLRLYGR